MTSQRIFLVAAIVLHAQFAHAVATLDVSKFGNLYYSSENSDVRVKFVNPFSGPIYDSASVELRDAYGVEHSCQLTSSVLQPGQSETKTCPFSSGRIGYFDVGLEYTMFSAADQFPPVVFPAVQTSMAIVPPIGAQDFDVASTSNVFFLPGPQDASKKTEIARQLRDLGVKAVRLNYYWADDDRYDVPNLASPDWLDSTEFEQWIDALRQEKILTMAELFGTARWASTRKDFTVWHHTTGPEWSLSTPITEYWSLLVTTLAQRLYGKVNSWELWNEGSSAAYFEPQFPRLDRSAAGTLLNGMGKTMSQALKAVDPANKLVVNLTDAVYTFYPTFLQQGDSFIDVFGFHYQDGFMVAEAASLLAANGVGPKPFWNTEAYGTPREIFQNYVRQKAAGSKNNFIFIYNISGVTTGELPSQYVVNPDYTPRLQSVALRTMNDKIGNAQFIGSFQVKLDGRVMGYIFEKNGKRIVVVVREKDWNVDFWGESPGATLRLVTPRARTQDGICTDLMGNTTVIPKGAKIMDLPADGNPIFIEDIDTSPSRPVTFSALF